MLMTDFVMKQHNIVINICLLSICSMSHQYKGKTLYYITHTKIAYCSLQEEIKGVDHHVPHVCIVQFTSQACIRLV